jgi:hypothetical protein
MSGGGRVLVPGEAGLAGVFTINSLIGHDQQKNPHKAGFRFAAHRWCGWWWAWTTVQFPGGMRLMADADCLRAIAECIGSLPRRVLPPHFSADFRTSRVSYSLPHYPASLDFLPQGSVHSLIYYEPAIHNSVLSFFVIGCIIPIFILRGPDQCC